MQRIIYPIFTYRTPRVNLAVSQRRALMTCMVRDSNDSDMAAVQAIYAHHVLYGAASFEEEPPPLAEMLRRRADVLARGFPYLVAEIDGQVAGYSYASPYRA